MREGEHALVIPAFATLPQTGKFLRGFICASLGPVRKDSRVEYSGVIWEEK